MKLIYGINILNYIRFSKHEMMLQSIYFHEFTFSNYLAYCHFYSCELIFSKFISMHFVLINCTHLYFHLALIMSIFFLIDSSPIHFYPTNTCVSWKESNLLSKVRLVWSKNESKFLWISFICNFIHQQDPWKFIPQFCLIPNTPQILNLE